MNRQQICAVDSSAGKQLGFSLIELLIVIGLMSVAAAMALATISGDDNQTRYQTTLTRLAAIQQAIWGESILTRGNDGGLDIEINGFVADMGRLPNKIEELLIEPTDCDLNGVEDSDEDVSCKWQYDSDTQTWGGWQGPYLTGVLAQEDNSNDIKQAIQYDGWGYEWDLEFSDDSDLSNSDLTVSSLGIDAGTEQYSDADDLYKYSSSAKTQTFTLKTQHYLRELPTSNIYVEIEHAPQYGQCVDSTATTESDCTAGLWDEAHEQCVMTSTSITNAQACDDENDDYQWMAVYGQCVYYDSEGTDAYFSWITDQPSCEALGTVCEDASSSCYAWQVEQTLSVDAGSYARPDFIDSDNPTFCIRALYRQNGVFSVGSFYSDPLPSSTISDASSYVDDGDGCQLSDSHDDSNDDYCDDNDKLSLTTAMTDDDDEDSWKLPIGTLILGLYQYDIDTDSCDATQPFPSLTAQGRSPLLYLNHHSPLRLGSSSDPFLIQWRSR